MSLAQALARAVGRAAGTRPVTAVFVDVGALRQVIPEALDSAWTFVVRGTALAGAALHTRAVPAVLACDDCGATTKLGPELGFRCPSCGSAATHLVSGEEFTLTAIDVADEGPSTDAQTTDPARRPDRTPDAN